MASGCDVIEPRHRYVVDIEGEALVGLTAQRKTDRGLDRSAMSHGNHVLAGMLNRDALDRAADTVVEIHKTFAAGCCFVDRREPMRTGGTAGQKRRAIHALPFAEMLFGKVLDVRHL